MDRSVSMDGRGSGCAVRARTSPHGLAWRLLLALAMTPAAAAAQEGDGGAMAVSADLLGPREAEAAPLRGAIRVDGRLSEEAWAAAPPVSRFVQGEPIEGARPQQRTEVRILFDDEALYIGARLYESDPSRIGRQLTRRDEPGQFDYFMVGLDPNRDRRTGYSFRVSAAGVQRDAYLYDDVRQDESFDAVWESAVSVDEEGWSVEMRIPLSQIRYDPSNDPQTWGVNFERRRLHSNEKTFFVLESRQRHGKVSIFAPLGGLELAGDGGGRLELRPYTLLRGRTGEAASGDPFFDGREGDAAVGLDLRYGLGTAFTLDATVNPDFGQVEVDPAVINLGAFETRFDEKRPFFVEDGRVFDFSLSGRENNLFYTRRIGRRPTRTSLSGSTFRDAPDASTILGAAKLTGRTAGGLSVGLLAALTGEETGRAYFEGADSIASFLAEPRTAFGVVRLQQDLRGGASTVGGIVGGLRRDLPEDGAFDIIPEDAVSAGVDFEHTWGQRQWALTGFLAGSSVRGEPAAITRIQRSAGHYFQRPDAPDLEVDSTATALRGAEWRLQLDRRSGRNWTGGVWLGQRTPGFEPNELGYTQGSERLDGGMRVTYREIEPIWIFRDYRVSAFTYHNWRHEALHDPWSAASWGHAHKSGAVNLSSSFTLLNYWTLNADVSYSPEFYSDMATRGGPLMTDPSRWSLNLRGNTDQRRAVSLSPSVRVVEGAGGSMVRVDTDVVVRPSPRFELSVGPAYSLQRDHDQYVTSTGVLPYAPTFGRRYLFADLDRRTLSLETRLSYTFTPTLTLQLFAQPLVSGGDYVTYKQLSAAESFDFHAFRPGAAVPADGAVACVGGDICAIAGEGGERTQHVDFDGDGVADYAFADRDFNIRSLRGNAVLRWEYRPGSTLFVVWQQQRYRSLPTGEFSAATDARELFDAPAENLLIIKANYWLSL
ncbi:MAG TPA: DUF5916 domain-containing protein [Longimicrobiales bacterium]|nr:DUF5916 domain-containing protein [Longimicrobiales bacterium]